MADTTPPHAFAHAVTAARELTRPIFHISRGAAHLTGVERFVPGLTFIRMRPQGDDRAEHTFIPSELPKAPLGAVESVNWLLGNVQVQRYIAETSAGATPAVIFSNFDASTEQLCAHLGYEILYPAADVRRELDSKVFATQLCERIGLDNVPNILSNARSWKQLRSLVVEAELGEHLVIQTAYGEGGEGTYFVEGQESFERILPQLEGATYKVMRNIDHLPLAVEAVATASGVIVGPVLREIVGHPELAVYRGSSSGLEYTPGLVSATQQRWIVDKMTRFGELLRGEGYRGLFEVDFLLDTDSGELYFGETNPRFSGCAMVTNAVTVAAWGVPLYAFHLLEFCGRATDLDVAALNRVWEDHPPTGEWANAVLRHVGDTAQVMRNTPASGTFRVDDAAIAQVSSSTNWFDPPRAETLVVLQYKRARDILVPGDETGLMLTSRTVQDAEAQLTPRGRTLIAGVQSLLRTAPLGFFTRAMAGVTRRLSRRFGSSRPPRQG